MHASGADAGLKEAVNDRNLSVVMAAAHALHLLNDPGVLRALTTKVYTGERKNDSGLIAHEMKVIHDPKQVILSVVRCRLQVREGGKLMQQGTRVQLRITRQRSGNAVRPDQDNGSCTRSLD